MSAKRSDLLRRHLAGVAVLNAVFDWSPEEDARLQKEKRSDFSNGERQRRRKRNRIARASRKRNRA